MPPQKKQSFKMWGFSLTLDIPRTACKDSTVLKLILSIKVISWIEPHGQYLVYSPLHYSCPLNREKYIFSLVTPQPLFDLFASACNVWKTLFTQKEKKMIGEARWWGTRKVTCKYLPWTFLFWRWLTITKYFRGKQSIIEANTWNGAEGEKTKASGNKL